MKKITILAVAVLVIAGLAIAGSVYDRTTVTAGRSTGTAYWTNTLSYAALSLKQVWLINAYAAGDTVTVQRITTDTVPLTNTVCVITNASNKGDAAYSLNEKYMKPNDILYFSCTLSTGFTAVVEYEVQKH
jgi:hypothetical protein